MKVEEYNENEKKALKILREVNEMIKKRDEKRQEIVKMINDLRLKLEEEKWQKEEMKI